jgi:hypothetical protein
LVVAQVDISVELLPINMLEHRVISAQVLLLQALAEYTLVFHHQVEVL